jgi:hypothetical protein
MSASARVWLFDARTDLAVFGGSAALSLALLGIGAATGLLHQDAPPWVWLLGVLLVDVAHVWSTLFRVYLDPVERARRPALYYGTPVAAFAVGAALHMHDPALFWSVLAYIAVFHFVRQQYGWVALYRARAGETTGRWLDTATIYACTLHPLLVWHLSSPRAFAWMRPGDFLGLHDALGASVSSAVVIASRCLWGALLLAYTLKAARAYGAGRGSPGKDLVVFTTAATWSVGIEWLNSDFAFTVTNVFVHGVPYLALVWLYARKHASASSPAARMTRSGLWPFLAVVWSLAFFEELLWDRGVWHEQPDLFGPGFDAGAGLPFLVALLATPQLTHYLLDAFVWRRGDRASELA